MANRRNSTSSNSIPTSPPSSEEAAPLRAVVLAHADQCFLDTDGITRDAARMLKIMETWHPQRSDGQAGVRRNEAFDPNLSVIVHDGVRICYPRAVEHRGQPTLLFTMVAPDGFARAPSRPSSSN